MIGINQSIENLIFAHWELKNTPMALEKEILAVFCFSEKKKAKKGSWLDKHINIHYLTTYHYSFSRYTAVAVNSRDR